MAGGPPPVLLLGGAALALLLLSRRGGGAGDEGALDALPDGAGGGGGGGGFFAPADAGAGAPAGALDGPPLAGDGDGDPFGADVAGAGLVADAAVGGLGSRSASGLGVGELAIAGALGGGAALAGRSAVRGVRFARASAQAQRAAVAFRAGSIAERASALGLARSAGAARGIAAQVSAARAPLRGALGLTRAAVGPGLAVAFPAAEVGIGIATGSPATVAGAAGITPEQVAARRSEGPLGFARLAGEFALGAFVIQPARDILSLFSGSAAAAPAPVGTASPRLRRGAATAEPPSVPAVVTVRSAPRASEGFFAAGPSFRGFPASAGVQAGANRAADLQEQVRQQLAANEALLARARATSRGA